MAEAQTSFMAVGDVPATTMEGGEPVKGLRLVNISG
jgi:hypothetical protein